MLASGSEKRRMRYSAPRTRARLIGAVPVLGVKKILGDPVLVPIVVAEIELARNYVVLRSDHAFKEFECAIAGVYSIVSRSW